jgi:hypothetical protein
MRPGRLSGIGSPETCAILSRRHTKTLAEDNPHSIRSAEATIMGNGF